MKEKRLRKKQYRPMRYFLGVDPGTSGAIGCIDENANYQWVFDLPYLPTEKLMDITLFRQMLFAHLNDAYTNANDSRAIVSTEGVTIYMEKVSPLPQMSAVSACTMCGTAMAVWGALQGFGFSTILVPPRTWKRRMNVTKTKGVAGNNLKEKARGVARQVWPSAPLGLKKHHDRAEALLIAKYGLLQELGK